MRPGLCKVMQLRVCVSTRRRTGTKSLLSKLHLQPCIPAKPSKHSAATCALYFFLTMCNHATFSWLSPGPATAPHARYIARGHGKDKRTRNITDLLTHLTAGRWMSFPNALACAEALPQCPCLRAFNAYDLSKGNFTKCQCFYQNSLWQASSFN